MSGKEIDTARQRFDTGTGYRYTLTFVCVPRVGPPGALSSDTAIAPRAP